MKKISKILFIFAVVLQTALLVAMIVNRKMLLKNGKSIILKSVPIDPRSLFTGDYVRLNYEISTLPRTLIINEQRLYHFKQGEKIYVALEKSKTNNHWQAAAVANNLQVLKSQYNNVIRGVIYYTLFDKLIVHYGLETYFVPQNQGRPIENNMADVTVEIALAEDGDSAIRKLFVGDVEVQFD